MSEFGWNIVLRCHNSHTWPTEALLERKEHSAKGEGAGRCGSDAFGCEQRAGAEARFWWGFCFRGLKAAATPGRDAEASRLALCAVGGCARFLATPSMTMRLSWMRTQRVWMGLS
jgi:hypothetical protein